MSIDWERLRVRLDPVADPALALIVFGLAAQPLLAGHDCDCTSIPAWGYLLVAVQSAPVAVRRKWPFAALFVTGLATSAYGVTSLPDPPVYYAALVLMYSVAAHSTRRVVYLSAAIAALSITVALTLDWPEWDYQDLTVPIATFVTAYVLGDSVRTRRERAAALEARATQLERARTAEAAAVVSAERNRIARELHDSVAHHVSVMVIQAEAGPLTVESRPGLAIETFESIGATGKQAMTEMRQLLGVLKEDIASPREPQPGLARVDDLVAHTRLAGLDVALNVRGTPRILPTALDLSAYRVIQEALTNCLRHAPGSDVTVGVGFGKELLLEVTDNGPTTKRSITIDETHSGNGLTAMHERVSLMGGQLDVGPYGSGWRVRATFPLPVEGDR